MSSRMSFGRRLALGFALVTTITVAVGLGGIYALESTSESKDAVLAGDARNMIRIASLRASVERKSSVIRGFLLTGDSQHQRDLAEVRADFDQHLEALGRATSDADGLRLLAEIGRLEREHQVAFETASRDMSDKLVAERAFSDAIQPLMRQLRKAAQTYSDRQEAMLTAGLAKADEEASRTKALLVAMVSLALLFAIGGAILLTRVVTKQVGAAIARTQSSAAELQTASSQQASSTREQSSAMSEIATTINELLVTSRQIAESAQRVAHIAEATVRSTRSGDQAMQHGTEAMATIRRQVDLIVQQMLDLGKRSQQIGGILDIINELADQTNILSINATIEAAGAGEHGRRFAVVADEIRRLADRVGGSTREIRGLIDEVRSAVNTAVMTTEGGSKAVEAGARQLE
ncbi:MAG TPA: methyl-accepting chemotaxis protein, partial [Myxococcota bacterium]|nr:methyl-accepting chemotaxis protein [Myxococcota bacterium]